MAHDSEEQKGPVRARYGSQLGIGLAIARALAGRGYSIIAVARDCARLAVAEQTLLHDGAPHVRLMTCDLTSSAGRNVLREALSDEVRSVDVLVNSAGIGVYGAVALADATALQAQLELNVLALSDLTRWVLPFMLRRRRGHILNLASLAAYQPGGPGMAAYYASKSYVLAFSRGLSVELRGSGVSVTVLSPGPTDTAFEDKSGATATRLYRSLGKSSPEAVARAGVRGMFRGRREVVPGIPSRLLAIAGELPPRRIALAVNRWLLQPVR